MTEPGTGTGTGYRAWYQFRYQVRYRYRISLAKFSSGRVLMPVTKDILNIMVNGFAKDGAQFLSTIP